MTGDHHILDRIDDLIHGAGPCTDRCRCPVHANALLYWQHGDEHACQDADCVHGHGGLAGHRPVTLIPFRREAS